SLCDVSESFLRRFVCRKVGRVLRQREDALSPFRIPSNESQTNGSRISAVRRVRLSRRWRTLGHTRGLLVRPTDSTKLHADGAHTFLKRLRRPPTTGPPFSAHVRTNEEGDPVMAAIQPRRRV